MVLYQEYSPCAALASYVACLWTCHVRPDGQALAHRVLPDNCIDILWQDCDTHGGVAGMMSTAMRVPFARPVRTIAVRFKPGAASQFFNIPLHELTDLHPALADVWDAPIAHRFAEALWSRPLSDAQAVAVVERLLLQRLQVGRRKTGLVEAAVDAIARSHGMLRIEALAESLGVTRQHLASQFRERVGLPAKQFARVCRFQHATRIIGSMQAHDWSSLALDLGYYDQPHMIHEFRELAGSTPHSFAPA